MQTRPIKRYRRFHGYDYGRGAAMFLTFSLSPRCPLFGRIRGEQMEFSEAGRIALEVIEHESLRTPDVQLKRFVVMPDHVHLRLYLRPGQADPLRKMGRFVYNVKAWIRKHCKARLGVEVAWEENYHDRICLSREIIEAADRYIDNNPLKWSLMHGDPPPLKVEEPLDAGALPAEEWWTGVGRSDWLRGGAKIAAVRLSRTIPAERHAEVVTWFLDACDKGYTLAGTMISPCERALFAELVRLGKPVLRASPKPLFSVCRPTGEEPRLFAEKRYLVISRVAGPDAAAGVAWHGLNAALDDIALATGGIGVYVRCDHGEMKWEFRRQG